MRVFFFYQQKFLKESKGTQPNNKKSLTHDKHNREHNNTYQIAQKILTDYLDRQFDTIKPIHSF